MRRALLLTSLLLPISCPLAQEAQADKQLPQEFAITTSVVLQDADELQSTADFRFFKLPDQKRITVAADFEYGLTDRWELDAEVPYEFVNPNDGRSVDGIGDVEAAVRYGVVPLDDKPFALTAGLGAGIPTGDRTRDLGEGRLKLEPFFTASTWLGRFNAQLNCGWQRAVASAGNGPSDEFEYNVAVIYPVDRWFLVLEGNGTSTREATTYYVTPELVCRLTKGVEFLLAVPIGVTGASADYGVIASMTLEFENVTHRPADKD
jgi:Putative MetA-pathway of phenol degradation